MSIQVASFKSAQKLWFPLITIGGVILLAASLALPNLLRSRVAADQSMRLHELDHMYASPHLESLALSDSSPASIQRAARTVPEANPLSGAAAAHPTATSNRKIVRTAALELIVKSPADAAEQARLLAESMGGYLEAAQIGGTKDAPAADITIRVPAAYFEPAKAQIRKLAIRVQGEKTDAQDVTRQYVDLESRLRNLRAEETQYLTIMKSAFKVEDLLEVAQKLSEVRGQIEQQQAEFQALSKQVETVAIAISLRTLADTQVFGLNWRPLYHLKLAARDGLEAIADYAGIMAAILFYVPVVLAWGLTILLAVVIASRLLRWIARRFFTWPLLPASGKPSE